MTRKELEVYVGQFGEIKLNGKYYNTALHGWVKGIEDGKLIFKLCDGNTKMKIPMGQVIEFIEKELCKSQSVPKY